MSLGLKGLKNPYCLHVPVNQNGSGMEKRCVVCSEAKTIKKTSYRTVQILIPHFMLHLASRCITNHKNHISVKCGLTVTCCDETGILTLQKTNAHRERSNLFHYIYFGHACYWQSTKETLMAKEIHQIVRQGTRLFIDIWFILFHVACIFKMHIKPSVCFLHLNPKNVCCVT